VTFIPSGALISRRIPGALLTATFDGSTTWFPYSSNSLMLAQRPLSRPVAVTRT